MKIKIYATIVEHPEYGYAILITVGRNRVHQLPVEVAEESGPYDPTGPEPRRVISLWRDEFSSTWAFRWKVVLVEDWNSASRDELLMRIKHSVFREEKALVRIEREVRAFENLERIPAARRERIPESVRLFVWQRDEGKCVKCGSQERLEFDHIIPVAEGGGNTARNVQLLCEPCNREKGKQL